MLNEGKDVYVNQKYYKIIVEKLGYDPSNLLINNYLPDNQAITLNKGGI